MGWKFNPISRVAKVLAILLALTSMNTIVFADENILSLPENGSEAIALKLPADGFELDGKDWSKMLQVFVGAKDLCCEGRTAVAGRYVIENHSLLFTPAFGFAEAQDYVARIQRPGVDDALVPFKISSQAPAPTAQVTGIFPSGDIIPENTLRFYVHFSAPMQPHVAFDHIKLVNADGVADEAAFMRFKQELWNEDRTRLTVLMDPGRIKRNVATNLEFGPALQEGNDYRLVITGGWMPVQGETALKKFSKTFSVGPALRELPNSDKWRISSPRSDTRDALTIKFDRPFDAGQLQKSIKIKTASGHLVDGTVTISENETFWSFKPEDNWLNDGLTLVVDPHLEDVAGNNFKDLLDHRAESDQIEKQ
ncbi:MAG: hypothetical protein JJ858_07170 [Rhizobiaceae bacterium]|nr:hypothetical protein [Rhizobiaceae bacterium]